MSEQPLKVLSVCTSLEGGAGRAAYRIHQAVRGIGVDSRMFVKYKRYDDPTVRSLDEFAPANGLYKAFDWVRNKCNNKLQHARWNRYPEREKVYLSDLRGTDLYGALRKLDYDVLHLHWINQRFISLDDLPKDKPIVWTLHDSWPFCGVCHYFLDCSEYKHHCGCCPFLRSERSNDLSRQVWQQKAEAFKNLDLNIVSPSRWLADCAKQSGLLKNFPITVIPNCLDVETFRPLCKERKNEKPTILYGALHAATDKIKGLDHLLSALKLLVHQGHGVDFELVVFGVTESELSLDVNVPIRYAGYVDKEEDMVSLYQKASVTVVPSLTENLSCTIMESLSCGTPVVAFNLGGNGDMIEHMANGYLAQAKDDADLAAGIIWCLENNMDQRLGMAGREKVLRNYSYEAINRQYKELYETLYHNH